MKLILLVATLPTLTYGFSMGAYDNFGRAVLVQRPNDRTRTASLQPRQGMFLRAHSTEDVDKAFDKLQEELHNSKKDDDTVDTKGTDETSSKSKMWVNRYFDLFADISRDASATEEEADRNIKELRKTQKLTNKVIDFATEFGQDLSKLDLEGMKRPNYQKNNRKTSSAVSIGSGEAMFSPIYSIKDDPTIFQVQLELPGVNIGDVKLEIDKQENVLLVSGQRQSIENAEPMKFSKRFGLDSTIITDKISAKLDKGILTVTAPKHTKTDTTRRVPISFGN